MVIVWHVGSGQSRGNGVSQLRREAWRSIVPEQGLMSSPMKDHHEKLAEQAARRRLLRYYPLRSTCRRWLTCADGSRNEERYRLAVQDMAATRSGSIPCTLMIGVTLTPEPAARTGLSAIPPDFPPWDA